MRWYWWVRLEGSECNGGMCPIVEPLDGHIIPIVKSFKDQTLRICIQFAHQITIKVSFWNKLFHLFSHFVVYQVLRDLRCVDFDNGQQVKSRFCEHLAVPDPSSTNCSSTLGCTTTTARPTSGGDRYSLREPRVNLSSEESPILEIDNWAADRWHPVEKYRWT